MEDREPYKVDLGEHPTDARQWTELGKLKDRIAKHETDCEKRHGTILARFAELETKIDANHQLIEQRFESAASGGKSNRELIAILLSAAAILGALFSGVLA